MNEWWVHKFGLNKSVHPARRHSSAPGARRPGPRPRFATTSTKTAMIAQGSMPAVFKTGNSPCVANTSASDVVTIRASSMDTLYVDGPDDPAHELRSATHPFNDDDDDSAGLHGRRLADGYLVMCREYTRRRRSQSRSIFD